MTETEPNVADLLAAHRRGDRSAVGSIFSVVYEELCAIARRELGWDRRSDTLNTQGLVHEAYLKLADGREPQWQNRSHFLSVAALAMRQVVVDAARRRYTAKRGCGVKNDPLEEAHLGCQATDETVLALDQALDKLQSRDDRLVRLVECRFFAGLTEQETAEALSVSHRTVQRDWVRARAWLRELMER